jgi:hypothetical protein
MLQQGTEMILERYAPSPRDSWSWRLANLTDIDQIVAISQKPLWDEVAAISRFDTDLFAKNLSLGMVRQAFNRLDEQIVVAEENNQIIAWAWLVRGSYTTYSRDEMADGRFSHVAVDLPVRKKITLLAQIIQQWIFWATMCGIPVIHSSTMRGEQQAFLRLHEQAGFIVRGSTAFYRIPK